MGVPDAVRRVVAIQAQHAASPYLALWNRLSGFDLVDLDAAFADRSVVKSNAERMTLHAVHADDYCVFREATEPSIRAAGLRDERFRVTGMTEAEADALVPEMLMFAREPRTASEMTDWLERRLGATPHSGVWWGLRQYAPLWHAPTGAPWTFGHRPAYVAPHVVPALADTEVAEAGLRALALRYLAAFGPASVADLTQFGLVQRSRARKALEALAGDLERLEGPSGEELFDISGVPLPDEDTPAPPRLMGMWDNILLAYADRSRIIPPDYRKVVIRSNGDTLPTLLVDGYVAGVWRAVEEGIEATAFHCLPDDVWEGLAAEARSLLSLLDGREREVYRRYHHWWG